jgi:catechol 2,3-dioxygenase-like lactoylglutathione lyase family enzyme
MATKIQIVIDCADPAELSRFWAEALGYRLQEPPEGYSSWPEFLRSIGVPEKEFNSASAVVDPDGTGPRLYFQRVPEPKTGKNRLHLDLNAGGGPGTPFETRRERVGAEVTRLEKLGAGTVRSVDQRGEHWVVMRDPEGNEFCVQ